MQHIKLTGNAEALGKQHGERLRPFSANIVLPPPEAFPLVRECEAALQHYAPELATEMRSLAEAAGLDYNAFAALTLAGPLTQNAPSCSIIAVMPERSADGKILVGRNYDFFYHISKDGAATYATYPEKGYASLGNCDIWVGREDGLNEKGLFIAMTATFLPGIQAGLAFWFIVRMILDRCATVDEALDLMRSIPHAQSRNYLIADKSGKAVIVEASIQGIETREAINGLLVTTNHNLCPAFVGKQMFIPQSSPSRYQFLQNLPEACISIDGLKAALNNREQGVCADEIIDGQGMGTLWSIVGHLDQRQFDLAEGTPSGTMAYHTLTF